MYSNKIYDIYIIIEIINWGFLKYYKLEIILYAGKKIF